MDKVAMRKMKEFLSTGTKTKDEILNFLNDNVKWGVTASQLTTMLNRTGQKVGMKWILKGDKNVVDRKIQTEEDK